MQVASNIDNGDYTYLYDLWYKHNFNKLSLQFGVIDLNADYLTTESGGLFLNSSFGIQPSASMNLPVPIFPMNALGLNLHYQINDALSIQSGIWDGDPGDLDREPYNVQWKLSAQQGILSATELCLNHTLFNQNSGVVKWGMLYHSAEFNYITDSTVNIKGNMQFHLIADQTLINKPEGEKGKLDAFLQVGYLPKNNINAIPFYLGGGFNYKGILFKNANDVLGLAFAHATLSQQMVNYLPNMLSYETAIELSYSMPIGENITIQPDLQYIINPGADGTIDNAFIAFTRVLISY